MLIPRRRRRASATPALASLALCFLAAAPLHAQRCLGFPTFAGQPMRIDGTLTSGNSITTLEGDLAFGQATGAFGGVGIGVADYPGSQSALLLKGNIGTQVQIGTPSRGSAGAQLCPVGALEFRSGPNAGDVDTHGLTLRGGVSLGTSLAMAPTVALAPFGTFSFAYQSATAEVRGVSATTSDVGGIIDVGAGFVFTNRFTVRPMVSIPVGFEGEDARFGLTIGFNFGGGR